MMYNDCPELPLEPKETPMPVCPVCGEECEDFFVNWKNEVIGCDCCLSKVSAYDFDLGESA